MRNLSFNYGNLKLNKKNFISFLKAILLNVILILAASIFFYKMHINSLNNTSDKFISLSDAWENIKTNKYMHELQEACDLVRNSQNSK